MLKLVAFAFFVYFVSLAVTSESVAARRRANALGSPPAKEDFGLESISEELPIVEPENPSFKSQFRRRALKPAQPRRPELPQLNMNPGSKFPIPGAIGLDPQRRNEISRANVKPALKYPIPRAMGPELPKIPVARKQPEHAKTVKAPARPASKAQKPIELEDVSDLNVSNTRTRELPLRQGGGIRNLKLSTIRLMEQTLYHTQDGNLKHVEAMATRYGTDKQYRMAFICLKMEELRNEMLAIYAYLSWNLKHYKWYPQWNPLIRVVKHMYYYTHLLKKNIDISYAVEYLIEHFSEM